MGFGGMKIDMKGGPHVPASDVERSKRFYERLGWRFDADLVPPQAVRIVQFTQPRAADADSSGDAAVPGPPGSAEGLVLVSDIERAHDELVSRGIRATEVFYAPRLTPEAHPEGGASDGSFFSFNDPDGNVWTIHQASAQLPERT